MKIKTLITIGIILLMTMIPATAAETTWIEPPEGYEGKEVPADAIYLGGGNNPTNSWVEPPTETFTPSGEVIDLREPKPDYVGSIDMQPSGEVIDLRENSQKTYDEENYVPVVEPEWTEPEPPEYEDNQDAGFVPSEPQTLNTQLGAKVTTTEEVTSTKYLGERKVKKITVDSNGYKNLKKVTIKTTKNVDHVALDVLDLTTGDYLLNQIITTYSDSVFSRTFVWDSGDYFSKTGSPLVDFVVGILNMGNKANDEPLSAYHLKKGHEYYVIVSLPYADGKYLPHEKTEYIEGQYEGPVEQVQRK